MYNALRFISQIYKKIGSRKNGSRFYQIPRTSRGMTGLEFRIFTGLDDPGDLTIRVKEEVIGTVLKDLDVRTVLGHGEVLAESGEVATEGDRPGGILADLELVAGRQF